MSRESGTHGGSGGSGASAEECEGEDEASSSLNIESLAIDDHKRDITSKGLNTKVDVELSNFRQQWQKELESPNKIASNKHKSLDDNTKSYQKAETEEEKAKLLFLKGVEYEESGELYEAIKYYKRAVQLIPDIEKKIYESTKLKPLNVDDSLNKIKEKQPRENKKSIKKHKEENHLAKIEKIVLQNGCICAPEFEQKSSHISCLPNELIMYILRWVVSAELDMVSLESFASVCRGFYILARDNEIWRLACVKTWGVNFCTWKYHTDYTSWRNMFIERPRLKFNGCYISTTTYVRPGENSFQDQYYRPWHMVKYFRYLRFFPDGVVLMLTTPDEPIMCLDHLKHRHSRAQGVLCGHYRLNGDMVIIVVDKLDTNQTKQTQASNSRFKSKLKDNAAEKTYHLEFQVKSHQSRKFCTLAWHTYLILTKNLNTNITAVTNFELVKSKFPSFKFSPVNRYHAKTDDPLQ